MSAVGSRWDWYEATFDGVDDDRVAPALALALGGRISRGKSRNGYAVCEVIERGDDALVQVYGHSARLGEVHVSVTSESCDEVVPLLRRLYPEHRVSRADSAVDFTADFDELDARVLAFATDRGLTHRLITNSDGGATRYVGSDRSEVMMRLYKKSEQLRALHPEKSSEIPDGIVRFELQVRPNKRQYKEILGRVTPDDAWGFSQWSGDLAELILSIESDRVSTHFRRPSDWTRALHFLGVQYGPMVQKRAEVVGFDQAARELLGALGL